MHCKIKSYATIFFFLFVFQPLTLFRSLLAVSQWKDKKKKSDKKKTIHWRQPEILIEEQYVIKFYNFVICFVNPAIL